MYADSAERDLGDREEGKQLITGNTQHSRQPKYFSRELNIQEGASLTEFHSLFTFFLFLIFLAKSLQQFLSFDYLHVSPHDKAITR